MATSYQDLPLTLDVHDLGRALHLSRSSAYRLLHEPGFPTLRRRASAAGAAGSFDSLDR